MNTNRHDLIEDYSLTAERIAGRRMTGNLSRAVPLTEDLSRSVCIRVHSWFVVAVSR